MQRLSSSTVDGLDQATAVPGYARDGLVTGIVHIGVGAFHRAHQAMYVDRLLQAGQAREWAVCGVGLLPGDSSVRDALHDQDCLYSLSVMNYDGSTERRVVGSIADYLFAPDDPEAVVERLAAVSTRIVSLTITEGGYNLDPATGRFDLDAEAVVADLARDSSWTTVFGLVVEALARRRDRGQEPFTIMCCDNIENNGDVARESFCSYADARDAALGAWVREQVSFPSSMVDRITPATTDADREEVARALGVQDLAAVVCEPFTQWVLEDRFGMGRPPLEEVGVQLVDDVRPYELMKLRLLNASHQAIAYLGYLNGYRYVHDAAADPLVVALLTRYMDREATPTLPPVPGVDLDAYKRTLLERFANPALGDTVQRLAAYASDRIPKWVLPVARANLADGGEVAMTAAVVAGWARYARGVDEAGQPITVVDHLAEPLGRLARDDDGLAFLAHRPVFGDLVDDDRFRAAYLSAWESLRDRGARATLEELVGPQAAR